MYGRIAGDPRATPETNNGRFCASRGYLTVPVHPMRGFIQRAPNTKTAFTNTYTSTRDNSTTVVPIDDALAAIESLEPGENSVILQLQKGTTLCDQH
jgi:hypothetical protein